MCLIAQANVKPCVAQKDIKVVKLLKKQKDGSYVTPFQGVPVALNSTLEAEGNSNGFACGFNDCRKEITSGFVHAKLRIEKDGKDDNIVGVVAYIPKGTEYFVNIYASEVCTKKLLITDEIVDLSTFSLTKKEMADVTKPFIEQLIPINKATPGWLFTAEKKFVHPLDYENDMDIIGVVAAADDNGKTSTVFALDEACLNWEDGVEYCKAYKTKGTNEDDWSLPDKNALQNACEKHITQINLALTTIGKKPLSYTYYWASAECSSTNVWPCRTNGAYLVNSSEWYSVYVRPSFAVDA